MSANTKTIAELAYALWVARGSPYGSPEIDWTEAEKMVRGPIESTPPHDKAEQTGQPPSG
jgi:Protein of unknown function (DUF2934)